MGNNTTKIIKKLYESKLDDYELVQTTDNGERVTRTTVGVKDKGKTIFHCHQCSHSETDYITVSGGGRGRRPEAQVRYHCKHPKMTWMSRRSLLIAFVSPLPQWCPLGNFQ